MEEDGEVVHVTIKEVGFLVHLAPGGDIAVPSFGLFGTKGKAEKEDTY